LPITERIATLAKCGGRVTATGVDETSPSGTDRIHLEQLELYARVGVTENERARPQRITLSLTAWPKAAFAKLEDDITHTLDYSELCRSVREFVERRPAAKLIETLASEVAAHLLKEFQLRAIEIELRKYVLPDVKHVAVIVRREAALD
jgi:7,8-dihydroneopterin aldolase/epimerase/oxygenase